MLDVYFSALEYGELHASVAVSSPAGWNDASLPRLDASDCRVMEWEGTFLILCQRQRRTPFKIQIYKSERASHCGKSFSAPRRPRRSLPPFLQSMSRIGMLPRNPTQSIHFRVSAPSVSTVRPNMQSSHPSQVDTSAQFLWL